MLVVGLVSRPAIEFTAWLMGRLTLGPAAVLVVSPLVGLVLMPVIGLVAALMVGLTDTSDATPTDPRRPVRDDLGAGIVFGIGIAPLIAIPSGIGAWITGGIKVGIAVGIVLGLASGLILGMYFLTGAGRRYLVFLYCSRGRLPRRLGTFLNWAYGAGLLRISGVAYQFRHRELQDWLTTHPGPGPGAVDPRGGREEAGLTQEMRIGRRA